MRYGKGKTKKGKGRQGKADGKKRQDRSNLKQKKAMQGRMKG